MNETPLLEALCRAGRQLHARDLLAAADGNLSALLPDGTLAMTPSGVPKGALTPEQMARLDREGRILAGHPSSERLMHLAIYWACPEARVVAHAHPPTAIAWTLARPDMTWLPAEALPEGILAAGNIPVVPYARPGSAAMGDGLLPFLPEHRLMILARHGAVAWGESVEEVVGGLERVEHLAKILLMAHQLGGAAPLPPDEVEALRALRTGLGRRLR